MNVITDIDIEDWIYMLNGGDSLQGAVIMSGAALMLGIAALVKLCVCAIKRKMAQSRELAEGDTKFLKSIGLGAGITCVVSIPVIITAIMNTRMSYFVSRGGIAKVVFGAVLLYIVISFIKVKFYEITIMLDAMGGIGAVILSVICLATALLFSHYEEEDWYVTTEVIDDLDQNTNRNDYAHLEGNDERVVIISRCAQDLWHDICDDKTVKVYVVYGEDDDPLVAFDMKENTYVGNRLVEE